MIDLLQRLKQRRKALGLRQRDMGLRVGMSRQQYQRLEAGGNPRLATLELVAKGLNSEIMLIPREKLALIEAVLADKVSITRESDEPNYGDEEASSLADDPWAGLLGDEQ
ncbi:transcriptional regulator [Alcanivorax sp. N3-2A]|nr:transcriptional regulator [Alcanivorax sp. N3-2A]|tara:strand:- start:67370 stop:67699 length:330 start_codon:yes stop_codon:yes gene_type:complete